MAAQILLSLSFLSAEPSASDSYNGFKLSNAVISPNEILSGGPGRDGIPSIDSPVFVPPASAKFLSDSDAVVSVVIGETARAYPLKILVWHEIVNDRIGNQAFMVTYCPLCGTAMVFDRGINGRDLSFGVSGLLYQSDVLMYDRETESLWSQLGRRAVSGDLSNTILELLPSEMMSWKVWKEKYPLGSVLSTETGFSRDYTDDPYESYARSPETLFSIPNHRNDLPKKAWVIGVFVQRHAKAYALDKLDSRKPIVDRIENVEIVITYDAAGEHISVKEQRSGGDIPYVKSYWFAWQAFYPETELWRN